MTRSKILLGSTSFDLDKQILFSKLSGDINPIHLDFIEARKSIAGECIVHGIHSFLWSIELLTNEIKYLFSFYEIQFKRYIPLNLKVSCFWDPIEKKLTIEKDGGTIFVLIKCCGGRDNYLVKDWILVTHKNILKDPKINDLSKFKKDYKVCSIYGGEIEICKLLFPKLFNQIGQNLIYEISIISNVIGMQIPGLNSLFANCKISLKKDLNVIPNYKITYFNKYLRFLKIMYQGKNIISEMKAFSTPKIPERKITNEIKFELKNKSFYKNKKVLIIGGSQGIGSFLVYVINLLGGEVSFTYKNGIDDANKISNEIFSNNPKNPVKSFKFDVINDIYSDIFKSNYDYLFYFATPKIFGKNGEDFDKSRYKLFKQIYCDSFEDIALKFIEKGGKNIFYPSTVAINENVKGLEEYQIAKEKGELICSKIKNNFNVNLLVKRLPRILTNQTLTILPLKSLDPLDVAIEIAYQVVKTKK